MKAETVALRFVDAINSADVERLAALMTEGHIFIDSDGSRVAGREPVLRAWSQYFSMVTDYRVVVAETYGEANTAVLVGRAEGRPARGPGAAGLRRWSVPAAWRAVVEGERLAVWQVFVNPEPILAAMRDESDGAA